MKVKRSVADFGHNGDSGDQRTLSDAVQARGQFVGSGADAANRFLKREYRDGYVVPEIG